MAQYSVGQDKFWKIKKIKWIYVNYFFDAYPVRGNSVALLIFKKVSLPPTKYKFFIFDYSLIQL